MCVVGIMVGLLLLFAAPGVGSLSLGFLFLLGAGSVSGSSHTISPTMSWAESSAWASATIFSDDQPSQTEASDGFRIVVEDPSTGIED